MGSHSTGLSLILGRVLSAWLEQLDPVSLDRYLEIGGFQSFQRAGKMTQLEVIAELRASGLRDRTLSPDPVYLKWHQYQQAHQKGRLVVDALNFDPRCLDGRRMFSRNPYGLLEGLLIASVTTGANEVLLLLPPELEGTEAHLFNAWEEVQARGLANGIVLDIQVAANPAPLPSVYVADYTCPDGLPALVHKLEVWYQLALVISLGHERFAALGQQGQTGSCLLTLLGAVKTPGLIETPLGGSLWQAVETLGGGIAPGKTPLALSLDNGMTGFLPAQTETLLAPEELLQAGPGPAPRSVEVLTKGTCLVDLTRRALQRYWILSDNQHCPHRTLIARAARLVTEVTRGKAGLTHLIELREIAEQMAARGLAAAWPLMSSLTWFQDQWQQHITEEKCPGDVCLKKRPAPCQQTCPAGIDIPSFLAHIGHGQPKKAIATISKDNPLPYVCGLVCPAPCEGACLRGQMDQSVAIRPMKAFAARRSLQGGGYPKPRRAKASGKTVAVVGSGPGGLTCAYYLALKGHKVTIFEAQEESGGMLRYGIPAYRLPHEILADETGQITRMGIEIKTGFEVENVQQLRDLGFDAIFLSLGTQLSRLIPIDGVDLPFVLGGLDFLKDVRGGKQPQVGPRVMVVGGGNVAIDVALSAVRQGAHRVDMACLEKRREMPASHHEIQQALDEGVAIHNAWGPLSVVEDGTMRFQRCTRVFDERGRFSPQFNPDRILEIQADHVILAIGQATDLACVERGSAVETMRGSICADEVDLQTGEEGVFAGGDVVYGPRTAVEAIMSGKRAAASMDAYLHGKKLDPRTLQPKPKEMVVPLKTPPKVREQTPRAAIPQTEVQQRLDNYDQVELGLDDQQAENEAGRCLRCDLCIGCGLCQLVCCEVGAEALRLEQTNADRLAFNDFQRPGDKCIGCGACYQACPTGAIRIKDIAGVRQTILTGTVIREQELLNCTQCGDPYAPQAYLDHLKNRVGKKAVEHVDRRICPACARKTRAMELAGAPFAGAM